MPQLDVKPDHAALLDDFRRAWSRDTSTRWTKDNPALGQCGVTSLVVNDRSGGELLKTLVDGRWHYYNRVDGRRVDITACQFDQPIVYHDIASNRDEAFSDTNADQYRALSERVGFLQGGENHG